MNLSQNQIDRIARAYDLAAGACCELVFAHREPGARSPLTPVLEKSSADLSAVCAVLVTILRRHDESARKERWREILADPKNGTRE